MFNFKLRYPILFIFSLFLLLELLSFLAYFLPSLQIYFLMASFLLVFIISLYSLETGVLISIAELVIGSKGHLFSASIFNFSISLRLLIWLALLLGSFVYIYRQGIVKVWQEKLKTYYFWLPILFLALFIIFASLNAYFSGNNFVYLFNDLNAWFFLAWLLPLTLVYLPKISSKQKKRLIKIFFISLLCLSIKSLFLLFAFSHNLSFSPDLYLWVRRSGIGEITAMGGGWHRIFIQSQIYAALAFLIIIFQSSLYRAQKAFFNYKYLIFLIIIMAVIILSMSRSFWLALAVAGSIGAIFKWRLNWRLYLKAIAYILASLIGAILLIFIIIKFPYPQNGADVSLLALSNRFELNSDEAAVASRWALLPELWQQIKLRPILGSGFGASVTYISKDPRVLSENPSGLYTTYAFEWAYLDTWLKLGLLGLIAFIIFIISPLKRLWWQGFKEKDSVLEALAIGLFFLMIVNIFTPYLNHPLGLAFVLISSCFVSKNPL